MKKFAVMAALAVAAISASAFELGVHGTHTAGASTDFVGVSLGKKFGVMGVEGTFDRSTRGAVNFNRFGLVGSYDVAQVLGATVSPKMGVAFIDPTHSGVNGYAVTAGVGVSYPVAKNVSLTADYAYQKAQGRVATFSGNQVSAGVKFAF